MVSMWSRNNVVWLRRRWACREDDPGRAARLHPSRSGSDKEVVEVRATPPPDAGRRRSLELIKAEFLARSVVIDCPHPGCDGIMLTAVREVERPGGSGTRLIFHCTREPESHEVKVAMEPYTAEEVERLKAAVYRGESLRCVRCATPLELGSKASQDGWGKSLDGEAAFYCSWCGVKWVASVELTRRAS